MKRLVSQKDIVPALLLTGALLLYFDVVMALAVFAVTALGALAVRRSVRGKERPKKPCRAPLCPPVHTP